MGGPGPRLSPGPDGVQRPAAAVPAPVADPATALRDVRLAVRAGLLEAGAPGGTVVLGVSGGPDSLAMLAAAVHVAPALRVRVHAVCVDHGWHPATGAVAVRTALACLRTGADDVRVVRVRPARTAAGGHPGGPEDAARTARLAALEGAAERDGAVAVLLGHTLDDQAEQVLLGLARGSGARALAGVPRRRGRLLRPLLGLRRDLVRAACPELDDLGLPWQDPANSEPRYLRARVRAELVPVLADVLGPGSVESLARSAALLRADDDALREWADRETAALLADVPGADRDVTGPTVAGGLEVPVGPLASLPQAVRTRVLRRLATRAGARALTSAHTRALDALVVGRSGLGPADLPGAVRAWRTTGADGCGRLRLASDPPPREDQHGRR